LNIAVRHTNHGKPPSFFHIPECLTFFGALKNFSLECSRSFFSFLPHRGTPFFCFLCGFVWGNYTLLNIPAFCSLFIMGRGRKGLLSQGQKSIDRKRRIANNSNYLFFSTAPCKTKKEPTVLPSTFIDTLKQMDPKAVAELLLE